MPKDPAVTAWLKAYDNPMKAVVARVRQIMLGVDSRIGECIKWQSPTFTFEGNLASFNPRSKKHASLMFHTGAQIPGEHPSLQGGGGTARYITFADLAEAEAKAGDLEALVAAWCARKSGTGTAGNKAAAKKKVASNKKAPAKRSAAAKKKAAANKKVPAR